MMRSRVSYSFSKGGSSSCRAARKAMHFLPLITLSFMLSLGCVGRPPLRTYTIARTALESARRAEGARTAPEKMHQAEEAYRLGEFHFRNRDYSSAADEFEESIKFSEEAENQARLNPRGE